LQKHRWANYNHLTEKKNLKLPAGMELLPEMLLKEIFNQHSTNKELYLWEIREGASFIGAIGRAIHGI